MYLSLKNDIIPNHGYVVISDIGSTDDTALICRTNRPANLINSLGYTNSGGNWFAPNGMTLDFGGRTVPGVRRTRDPMMVRLLRNTANGPPSEGIYHCLVEDDTLTEQTVNVGLYNSGGGTHKVNLRIVNPKCTIIYWAIIYRDTYMYIPTLGHAHTTQIAFFISGDIVISNITYTMDSDLNGANPQFTLTCISTGGPATTVTWTRDSDAVTEGSETVLDDPVTAQYTHSLTVTGRLGALYTCTVANDKPSEDSAMLDIQGTLYFSCSTTKLWYMNSIKHWLNQQLL